MLMRGRTITAAADPLQPFSPEQLYRSVATPSADLSSLISQLRIVRTLDAGRYRKLKTQLPYVVCGHYQPPVRRMEHFAHTNCFILDLDHLSDKEVDLQNLRQVLMTDERLTLLFTSPGSDGLKLLFTLEEKCYDAGKFRVFYKTFARGFAQQYNLQQVVDERTSDVTRACFLSADPDAFYNPNALPVNIDQWVDFENDTTIDNLFAEIRADDRALKTEQKSNATDLNDEVLQAIRSKLLPKSKPLVKEVYVPQELAGIEERLTRYLADYPIELEATQPISYGKKVMLKAGNHKAEINVFYGKRGFSVVATTKSGTHEELASMCKNLIEQMLQE